MKLNTIDKKPFYIFNLINKKTSKGTSSQQFFYKNLLPIHLKFKQLWVSKKWNAGRNKNGMRVLRTKGSYKTKYRIQVINYSYRYKNIFFIANFIFNSNINKLISLIFLSSGAISHLITTSTHELFMLNKFYWSQNFNEYYINGHNISKILQPIGLIMFLPKNKTISLLELIPYKGIQYIRSIGVFGVILKMDLRVHTALIKLPSGVKKIFSTQAIGSIGSVALPINKNFKNTKSGFYRKKGIKSIVRGVAMNPVDHPHGGRNKAIKYQRTPWGKTTKFK